MTDQNILDVDNPMSILKASVFGNIDFDDLYITFDNNENLKSLNAEDFNNILEENKFDIINRYCYEHDLLSFDDDKKIR